MSCSEADTKKYCWRSRKLLPSGRLSDGYSTFEMTSAIPLCCIADIKSPLLKAFMSKPFATALHSRSTATPLPPFPTIIKSCGTASTE